MSSTEWAHAALQSFDAVVQSTEGFRGRAGQRSMAEQVAQAFSTAELGKPEDEGSEPVRAIAVIQAGTGVGKSLAYCAPAIALALARNTRVLISTATVALQEQLVNKDLPALAAQLPQPFKFALAKGRGRYVCKLKLERLAGTGEAHDEEGDDLFPEEAAAARPRHETEARMQFYAGMAQALAQGGWDGDRDTLDTPPEPEVWSPVAAEGASCTGKHCPVFSQCTYYDKRKELVGAQVIVANHDLLLSSLGARMLPELDNCLLVLDEAHHLPATALDQFACSMDLSRLTWIDRLASRGLRIGQLVEVGDVADIPRHASELRQALQDLARLVMDLYGEALRNPQSSWGGGRTRVPDARMPSRVRVPGGVLPEALVEPLGQLAHHAGGFLECLRAISKALRAEMRDKPDEARRLSALYAQIGMLAPRLEAVHATAQLLLQDAPEGAVPAAKWFTLEVDGDFIVVKAHASPILPGATLRQHLWGAVRGAVLTSATLTSCGNFDFFMRESGLYGDDAATTLEVPSPFDYAAQGTLIAAETRADPKNATAFTAEMVDALMARPGAGGLRRAGAVHFARAAAPGGRCAADRHAPAGAGADRAAAHPAAGAPPRARGGGPAVHHLRHAVVRRRARPARAAVRIGVHHQAAVCAARRPGGRGARRVAARRRARSVQRAGGAGHGDAPGAMGRPRDPHRGRPGARLLLRPAPDAHPVWPAPAQGPAAVHAGAARRRVTARPTWAACCLSPGS